MRIVSGVIFGLGFGSIVFLSNAVAENSTEIAKAEAQATTQKAAEPLRVRPHPSGDEGLFTYGSIVFSKKDRSVTFPAALNLIDKPLEYAVVGQRGKLHETLLKTEVRAFDLQIVLLLLGYSPSVGDLFEGFVRDNSDPRRDQSAVSTGDSDVGEESFLRMSIVLETSGKADERISVFEWLSRSSSLAETSATLADAPWQFTGLRSIADNPYRPQDESSLAALYLDPFALLNFTGEGNRDDETWLIKSDLKGEKLIADMEVSIELLPWKPEIEE